MRAQPFDGGEREHADHCLGLLAAGCLEVHLGHAEQAVQRVLDQVDVLDPRVGNVPLVSGHDPFADDDLVGTQLIAVGQVLDQRADRCGEKEHHDPDLGVAAARGEEDDDPRQHSSRRAAAPRLNNNEAGCRR